MLSVCNFHLILYFFAQRPKSHEFGINIPLIISHISLTMVDEQSETLTHLEAAVATNQVFS